MCNLPGTSKPPRGLFSNPAINSEIVFKAPHSAKCLIPWGVTTSLERSSRIFIWYKTSVECSSANIKSMYPFSAHNLRSSGDFDDMFITTWNFIIKYEINWFLYNFILHKCFLHYFLISIWELDIQQESKLVHEVHDNINMAHYVSSIIKTSVNPEWGSFVLYYVVIKNFMFCSNYTPPIQSPSWFSSLSFS